MQSNFRVLHVANAFLGVITTIKILGYGGCIALIQSTFRILQAFKMKIENSKSNCHNTTTTNKERLFNKIQK